MASPVRSPANLASDLASGQTTVAQIGNVDSKIFRPRWIHPARLATGKIAASSVARVISFTGIDIVAVAMISG